MSERVHNEVNAHRLRKGITQEELAGALSVSRQTIISIEKGNYAPSVLLALKIARYFKCPLEELFTIRHDH